MLEIDGSLYNVPVLALKRSADFLDKYAERTEDGCLHRELIGVYYNYQLELGTGLDVEEYARLWNKLTEPVEFHTVGVPAENGSLCFTAYFSGVSDTMLAQKAGRNFFEGLTVNFTARSPARGAL